MQTLVAFQAYVAEKYAPKTAKMYWGDVRELSIYLRNKKIKDISAHDLQQWIGSLVAPSGKGLERKTVNRKVSAIILFSVVTGRRSDYTRSHSGFKQCPHPVAASGLPV